MPTAQECVVCVCVCVWYVENSGAIENMTQCKVEKWKSAVQQRRVDQTIKCACCSVFGVVLLLCLV